MLLTCLKAFHNMLDECLKHETFKTEFWTINYFILYQNDLIN